MKRKTLLHFWLLLLCMIVGGGTAWAADPDLTLDFTSAWTAGNDNSDGEKVFTKIVGTTTYTISGKGGKNFKFNNGYFIFGQKDAYINLPIVDFDVEKIEVVGNSGASSAVLHNIFVGTTAVSTEIKGITGTNTFAIASGYQAANTQYVLKVTSAHNAQVTYIKYYKKSSGGGDTPTPTTYTITFDAGNGTFVGNTDFPNTSNTKAAGTYTLPSATPATGYTFDGWTTTGSTSPLTGSYTVSGNVAFTAKYSQQGGGESSEAELSLDFTTAWNEGTGTNEFTNGTYSFTGSGSDNYKFSNGYFILGKKNAYINLPVVDFAVEKIVVVGRSGASGSTEMNIYVKDGNDEVAVSTKTTGSTGTNTYIIDEDYQDAGTQYILKVVSSHNAQITEIKYYKKENGSTPSAKKTTVTIDASGITNTNVHEGTAAGKLTATVSTTEGALNNATVTWTSSNTGVATIGETTGVITLVGAGTTTIKAEYAGVEGEYKSSSATYELTVINNDPNAPGTENNPYTVAQARAAIDAGTGVTGVYATGIVSEIVTAYSSQHGNISYNISADGLTTSDQLQAYRGKGKDGANFTSEDDIQVGDVVVVYGNLTKYGNTYEFASDNQLVSLTRPENPAVATTVTIDPTGITNTNKFVSTAAGTLTATVATVEGAPVNGATVTWTSSKEEVATIDANGNVTLVGAGITTITASYAGVENQYKPSSAKYELSVSNSDPNAQVATYEKVTSTDDITDGEYLIVYEGDDTHKSVAFNGALETLDAASNGVEVEISDGTITGDTDIDAAVFTIDVQAGTLQSASGKYIGVSSNSNGLKQSNTADTYTNSFSIDNNGNAVISAVFEGSTMSLRYNYASDNLRFRYFKSGQQAIQLYKKVGSGVSKPKLTVSDLNLAYDATSGSIEFTITNPVTGGSVSAAKNAEADWITSVAVNGNTVVLACQANNTGAERTATITLTYTYNNTETVTKNVTVTQAGNPNIVATIAEVRAQEEGSLVKTKGIVTSVNGKTAYMQDNEAAIAIYNSATNLEVAVGDEVKVEGTLGSNKGLLQITSPTVEVLSQGNNVTPEVMTIAEINASTNQGWLVKIEEATVTAISGQNVTIAQGENTIVVRFNIANDVTTINANDIITLTGNIGYYNTIQIANPTDITVQENEEPTINASDVTLEYDATSGAIEYTLTNPAEGVTLEATTDADWISDITVRESAVTFTTTANEGEEDRTATFTLTYTGAEDKTVTVTQKHFVVDYATLPFSWEGGASADFKKLNGVTTYGLGSDYAANNDPYLIKLDGTGDYIQVKTGSRPGKVTINVKMIGGATTSKITVQSSVDGETFDESEELEISGKSNAELKLETTQEFAEDTRYIRMTFTKGANVGVGAITIAKYVSSYIAVAPDEVDVDADEHEGTLAITYKNLQISNMNDFDIQYYDAEGEEVNDPGWIEVVVAEEDPSVGEGYVVSYYMVENENQEEGRTAYFKVYALDGNDFVYSNLVTITQDKYVINYATLPFEWDDNTTPTGVTNDGVGTYNNSPYLKFDTTGDNIVLKINEAPSVLAFDIKGNGFSGGTFTVQTSANGTDFTDLAEYTELTGTQTEVFTDLNSEIRYIKWIYTEKVSGNVALGNIKVYNSAFVETVTTANFAASGYASFCSPLPLDLTPTEDYAAWAVTDVEGTEVTFTKIEGAVPAGTPFILYGKEFGGQTATLPIAKGETTAVTVNMLKGTLKETEVSAVEGKYTNFGLSGGKFVKMKDGVVKANKAYLPILTENVPANARLNIVFADESTGIKVIDNSQLTIDNAFFDLQGRRIQQPTKGLYIKQGKKLYVK